MFPWLFGSLSSKEVPAIRWCRQPLALTMASKVDLQALSRPQRLTINLKRVIVTPAVYPRLVEFLHFDIQSTGQKSHCVNTF